MIDLDGQLATRLCDVADTWILCYKQTPDSAPCLSLAATKQQFLGLAYLLEQDSILPITKRSVDSGKMACRMMNNLCMTPFAGVFVWIDMNEKRPCLMGLCTKETSEAERSACLDELVGAILCFRDQLATTQS
jgi:hypothetical protein